MSGKKISEFVTENPGAEADYSEDAYLHAVQSGADVWLRLLNLLDRTTRSLTKVAGYDADGRPGTADIADYDADEGDFFQADGAGGSVGRSPATATQALDTSNSNSPLVPSSLAGFSGKGSNIASASTITIPDDGDFFHVTGTTTITAIAWATGGRSVALYFEGAVTIAHNGTALVVVGGASYTTSAGDIVGVVKDGSTVRVMPPGTGFTGYTAPTTTVGAILALREGTNNGTNKVSLRAPASITSDYVVDLPAAAGTVLTTADIGKIRDYISAAEMWSAITSGADPGVTNAGSNQPDYMTFDFDTGSDEFAHFHRRMHERYDGGTIKFFGHWTSSGGSGTVAFGLQGVACGDGDTIAANFGTRQTSSDTLLTAGQEHTGPLSSAITIAGTPQAGDVIFFRVSRDTANDNLGQDAKLIGITIEYNTTALKDA